MLTGITWGAAILALAVLVFLVGFILIRGVKNLTLEQFAWTYKSPRKCRGAQQAAGKVLSS